MKLDRCVFDVGLNAPDAIRLFSTFWSGDQDLQVHAMSDMIGCHCTNAVRTDGYMSKGVGCLEYSAIGPVRYFIIINTLECVAQGIWVSSEVIVLKARMFRGMSVNV